MWMESGEARKLLLVSPPRSGFISIGRPEVATGIDNFAAKILEKLGSDDDGDRIIFVRRVL